MGADVEASRREAIRGLVAGQGKVTVAELASRLDVSAVTIRKDLTVLERRGVLCRVHGGAVRTDERDEGSFAYRLNQAVAAKEYIARRAACLVRDGDTIVLDSSTTCYYLAQRLLSRRDLMVVTNNLVTAMLFLDHSKASVYLFGGILRSPSRATISPAGHLAYHGIVNKGFFSVNSLDTEVGLCDLSLDEAETKRSLATNCEQIYGLVDSTKFSGLALNPWLVPERLTGIFTDAGAPAAQLARWSALGVKVDNGGDRRC